ncbi:uncharacterized protein LOC126894014 [Daktulosphaira vitifoliae]|uniref:uncharacterized protein LOC126894014 n=1 Tax=Daktulosphaira vitifoliae TaxID=58002 RepID=UPI0021AAD812|nr:uncharacterized protein LOC126894014 [Daktulosphaira vitifoliae]
MTHSNYFIKLIRRYSFRCIMVSLALHYVTNSYKSNGSYCDADTAYLHWSTELPAVTVCYSEKNLMYSNTEVDYPLNTNILTRTKEFRAKNVIAICNQLFKSCSWCGKKFNCCRHFQSNRLLINQPCYSINSLQTIEKRKKLSVSHFSKIGPLIIEFSLPSVIALHDPTYVLFGKSQEPLFNIHLNNEIEIIYSTRQIIEDSSLTILDSSKRGCLLRNEKKLIHHNMYSQTACLLECAMYKPSLYALNETFCNCLPNCAEIELKYIWNHIHKTEDNTTRCILTMIKPATERLILKAKKDFIDLIIILACLMKLFTGLTFPDILKCFFKTSNSGKVLSSPRPLRETPVKLCISRKKT